MIICYGSYDTNTTTVLLNSMVNSQNSSYFIHDRHLTLPSLLPPGYRYFLHLAFTTPYFLVLSYLTGSSQLVRAILPLFSYSSEISHRSLSLFYLRYNLRVISKSLHHETKPCMTILPNFKVLWLGEKKNEKKMLVIWSVSCEVH